MSDSSVSYLCNDPEKFSVLNQWQYGDCINPKGISSNNQMQQINEIISTDKAKEGKATALDAHKAQFMLNQYSPNPFLRMSYNRQTAYMDEQKWKKKQEVKQKLLMANNKNMATVI